MGKRKREEGQEEISVKQRRVQHKLKLGVTKIGHAFKVSKGFERQKLGRRQKNAVAQSNRKDVERIESEIAALKTLDTTASAQHHFYKSLLKIKAVSDHPHLPEEVGKTVRIPSDSANLNVNARLCKSNQVKEALASAVDDVQQSLGIPVEKPKSKKSGKTKAANAISTSATQLGSSNAQEESQVSSARRKEKGSGPEYDGTSESDDLGLSNDDKEHSPDLDAGGDAEVEALERQLASEGFKPRASGAKPQPEPGVYDLEADLSLSEAESESRSSSPEHTKTSVTKRTSFLPSLTMAGYVAGEGSDSEDDNDPAPKKNRRGQRARQQIWEQKYGAKAKHLNRQDRNAGWDPKRGAVDGERNRHGAHSSERARRASPDYTLGGKSEAPRRGVSAESKRKHRDDGGPIHPSWQAAKKAREIKDAPVAFQGKKITFD